MKKLLILDDNEDNLEMFALIFDDSDFETHCLDNSADLKEALSSFKPDIIILDIKLHDGDGIKICNELKRNSGTSHIAIILISAAYTKEKISTMVCEADLFIEKPFDIDELTAAVRRFV
jgi:DNA-binding response OmpR family regulator